MKTVFFIYALGVAIIGLTYSLLIKNKKYYNFLYGTIENTLNDVSMIDKEYENYKDETTIKHLMTSYIVSISILSWIGLFPCIASIITVFYENRNK